MHLSSKLCKKMIIRSPSPSAFDCHLSQSERQRFAIKRNHDLDRNLVTNANKAIPPFCGGGDLIIAP